MDKSPLYGTCYSNLARILTDLQTTADGEAAKQLAFALVLAKELKELWDEAASQAGVSSAPPSGPTPDCDPTNYRTYALLRDFGSTLPGLEKVAESEGLHEITILRMLRLSFGLGLEEARSALGSAR